MTPGGRRCAAGAIAAAVAVTALTGCSQIAALAPVGGNALAEVRFGAIDVLQQKNIEVLTAPVCAQAETGPVVTCSGTSMDGRQITVTSSVASDAQLIVALGEETIFSGSLAEVLDEAARG